MEMHIRSTLRPRAPRVTRLMSLLVPVTVALLVTSAVGSQAPASPVASSNAPDGSVPLKFESASVKLHPAPPNYYLLKNYRHAPPYVIPTSAVGNGARSGIVGVILVIDTRQVAGYTIGSIADFAAMLALTVVQSPQQCDPLPSILDLMSPSCPAREQPAGVTAGDLAFLKGLYYHNTGLGSSLTRDEIERNMLQQFKSRLPAPRAVAVSPGPMSSD